MNEIKECHIILFQIFEAAFRTTQELISQGLIVSGHDISDGGLITTLLEMAFAGNCGLTVDIPCSEKQYLNSEQSSRCAFCRGAWNCSGN